MKYKKGDKLIHEDLGDVTVEHVSDSGYIVSTDKAGPFCVLFASERNLKRKDEGVPPLKIGDEVWHEQYGLGVHYGGFNHDGYTEENFPIGVRFKKPISPHPNPHLVGFGLMFGDIYRVHRLKTEDGERIFVETGAWRRPKDSDTVWLCAGGVFLNESPPINYAKHAVGNRIILREITDEVKGNMKTKEDKEKMATTPGKLKLACENYDCEHGEKCHVMYPNIHNVTPDYYTPLISKDGNCLSKRTVTTMPDMPDVVWIQKRKNDAIFPYSIFHHGEDGDTAYIRADKVKEIILESRDFHVNELVVNMDIEKELDALLKGATDETQS